MIKDGSSHDEHKHSLIQSLIHQKSDTGNTASPSKTFTPFPHTSKQDVFESRSLSGRAAAIKRASEHLREATQKLNHSEGRETKKSLSGRAAAIKHAGEHLREAADKLRLKNHSVAFNASLHKNRVRANLQDSDKATAVKATANNTEEYSPAVNATNSGIAANSTETETTKTVNATVPGIADEAKNITVNATLKSTDIPGKNKTKVSPIDLLAYSKEQGQPGETIHVLFTSNGSPYQNFQARIMVAGFRLAQKMPGGDKMVAMTRILHRTTPDEVMEEIPTFRADPLQPECDKWCW